MSVRVFLLPLLLLLIVANGSSENIQASANSQENALIKAFPTIVRIRPLKDCDTQCRRVGISGSGVIIDTSGLVLTAWHVVTQDLVGNLPYDDFAIEVFRSDTSAPTVKYLAQFIAYDQPNDLALLRIVQLSDSYTKKEVQTSSELNALYEDLDRLPVLPLARNARDVLDTYSSLSAVGYPTSSESISIFRGDIRSWSDAYKRIILPEKLGLGFSGGPAIAFNDDNPMIVGIVITQNLDEPVSYVRNISELHDLQWLPASSQVWGNVDDEPSTTINVKLRFVDYINKKGKLIAYIFNESTDSAWTSGTENVNRTVGGQIVLQQPVENITRFIERRTISLDLRLSDLQIESSDLISIHIVFWDEHERRVQWQDRWEETGWQRPTFSEEISSTPTPTPIPFVIQDQLWDGSNHLYIDNTYIQSQSNERVWIVIVLSGYDPEKKPLAYTLLNPGRNTNVPISVSRQDPEVNVLIEELEQKLYSTGSVQLSAYLFINKGVLEEFDPPNDILMPFSEGGTSKDFRLYSVSE